MSGSARQKLSAFLQNPLVAVVQASSVLHCINEYAFSITTCAGPSMMPTFNMSGDVIFVEKFALRNGSLDRGDVVIAITPQNAKQMVCKRIIAKPGETVLVRSKSWYTGDRPERVPQGHVWLEGDNADNSTDSRTYGPVPLSMVRGRVFFKAWPPTEIGRIARQMPDFASPVFNGEELEEEAEEEEWRDAEVRHIAAESARRRDTRVASTTDGKTK